MNSEKFTPSHTSETLESDVSAAFGNHAPKTPKNGASDRDPQNPSGTELALDRQSPVLEEAKLKMIAQGARNSAGRTERDYYRYVRSTAKKEGLPYGDLLAAVREKNKELRFGEVKDKVKFYHSTSLANLPRILESGELLSRDEREKRGEDVSKLQWSSSQSVQFTHDLFDRDGNLTKSGLGEGYGASGSEVTFVFGGALLDEPSFDATPYYPIAGEVNLSEKCLGVIAKDQAKADAVRDLLDRQHLDLPVYTAEEYDPQASPHDLEVRKARQRVMRNFSEAPESGKG